MNILILAAGNGTEESGYPIWLSEVDGMLLLERQILGFSEAGGKKFIYAFRQCDILNYHVDAIIDQFDLPAIAVIPIKHQTAGAALTALLAVGELCLDDELIVASATDHAYVDYKLIVSEFREKKEDVGLLTFDSLHPRYSYVKFDEDQLVVEAAEKRPISRRASAGFYWYARASDFVDSLKEMILKDVQTNGIFYISASLNELVLQGRRIVAHHLRPDQYHPIKDQRQVNVFEHHIEERPRYAS